MLRAFQMVWLAAEYIGDFSCGRQCVHIHLVQLAAWRRRNVARWPFQVRRYRCWPVELALYWLFSIGFAFIRPLLRLWSCDNFELAGQILLARSRCRKPELHGWLQIRHNRSPVRSLPETHWDSGKARMIGLFEFPASQRPLVHF